MFLMELGSKAGTAIAAARKALSASPSPNILVAAEAIKSENAAWNPQIKGKAILTPGLRQKLADALGHMAYNMHMAESGRSPL
jgi:hypothetical protein